MKKLEECNWKAFCLEQLFQIKIGKNIDKICADTTGNEAYITRTEFNNGLVGFIEGDSALKNEDFPVITIGNETAKPFVQNFPFFTGTKVNIMVPKVKMSVPVLKFIATSLDKHRRNFSYSFTANSTRLKELQIMLPAVSEEEPDYAFMEEYMREVERQQKEKYKSYIQKKIEELGNVEKLENKEWKAFFIEKVCEIESGQDIYQTERTFGFTPYITATAEQNGIGYFVGNNNDTLEEDCISVNRNGSVGYAFYHPYKALYGNDTRKLRPRVQNKYASIFISSAITQQKEKYGYGLKMGTGRLKRQYIMLPINSEGEPDYIFMESYMKRKEMEILKRYVERIK